MVYTQTKEQTKEPTGPATGAQGYNPSAQDSHGGRIRKKHPPHKYGDTFLEKNVNYMLIYNELLKDERVWSNSGQYWLAKEAGRRAKCLLDGDVDGYVQWKKSEDLCVA